MCMPEQKRSVSAYFFFPRRTQAGRGQRTLPNRAGTANQADTGRPGAEDSAELTRHGQSSGHTPAGSGGRKTVPALSMTVFYQI